MKKISRISALLTAGALLFGAIGCSDGGSSGGGGGGKSPGKDDPTSATVKYLQLTNTSNSSDVTPDFSATVSDTSVVTATGLVWTLVDGLAHSQWDIKVNNNGVAEAILEEVTTGVGKENGLASVSFDITAVKALKLKTISAITSSGKSPTGITCWIDGKAVAQGVQYSDDPAAAKSFKLSDASLNDYEVAAGDTVTIKITSDKTGVATEGAKIDFGQISLTVEAAETAGSGAGGAGGGGGGAGGGGGTTYTLLPSDISSWTTAKTELTAITTDGAKFQAGAAVTYDAEKIKVPSIKLAGAAQKEGKACIVLTTTKDNVVVTVKFASNGDSANGRYIVAIAGTETSAVSNNTVSADAITDETNATTKSNQIETASITLPTAGTYSIGGSAAIYVTEISLTM